MKPKKKEDDDVKIIKKPKLNKKIEEILADYPEKLRAYPRANFEEQLGQHLLKHKVK